MERFSIENKVKDISFGQFKEVADTLYSALKEVRPSIANDLRLTTNEDDYRNLLSEDIAEGYIDAIRRKEHYYLNELNESLWKRSLEVELIIEDNASKNKYAIYLANGVREPGRIFIYSEALDTESGKVLNSLWSRDFLRNIGEHGDKGDAANVDCKIGNGQPCNGLVGWSRRA